VYEALALLGMRLHHPPCGFAYLCALRNFRILAFASSMLFG